ncbi:hypothetical protein DL95DRAFT_411001 [Leptodontidium sp. 2 PMI_412]|nr:hypothetical protein BKA61DRAFT_669514 [Leptodontidium sp. MPI-SDFR-AT-0119]KAH9212592.1 hypothetical protein DL95DRAFT_411001 [Leptodontidium sp. 2 PMI_412]
MSYLLPSNGKEFILDWMCFLHNSSPAIDFGPRRDSNTALPDSDHAPHMNNTSRSREKAPACKPVSRRRQQTQYSIPLSEPGLQNEALPTSTTAGASKHLTGSSESEYDGVISESPTSTSDNSTPTYHQRQDDLVCWDHGCNGRGFTTSSNLARHRREYSDKRPTYYCPKCGAFFSRKTARNTHVENQSCTRIRRYSNGRKRPKVSK